MKDGRNVVGWGWARRRAVSLAQGAARLACTNSRMGLMLEAGDGLVVATVVAGVGVCGVEDVVIARRAVLGIEIFPA